MTVENFSEHQIEKPEIDKKMRRILRSLTTYLTLAAFLNLILAIVGVWAILSQNLSITPIAIVSVILSLVYAGSLYWCVRLLDQRRLIALWVFLSIISVSFLFYLAVSFLQGETPFSFFDIIIFIVWAVILFDMYRLKRNGVLL